MLRAETFTRYLPSSSCNGVNENLLLGLIIWFFGRATLRAFRTNDCTPGWREITKYELSFVARPPQAPSTPNRASVLQIQTDDHRRRL
jgi:hypothetical protein